MEEVKRPRQKPSEKKAEREFKELTLKIIDILRRDKSTTTTKATKELNADYLKVLKVFCHLSRINAIMFGHWEGNAEFFANIPINEETPNLDWLYQDFTNQLKGEE